MADHYFGNNETFNIVLQYLIAEVIKNAFAGKNLSGARVMNEVRDLFAEAAAVSWR